ncbi:hypothetical protein RHMOL_Rhmol08G0162500 [Rhododendron molle]|uniref:Uncharacterized protein n=1 Tax=Rhododendron molle TaxID=49168 RepID=A0ACC0MNZ1_RHOML|nr:hypothetical protein RHMOL_Rhmol08G0162500 [Rhododendron molle]
MRRTPLPPFVLMLLICLVYITCVVVAAEIGSDAWPETVDLDSGGLSRETFPKGFVFGTATSAYQVEGMANKDGRGPSIWDVFIKTPGLEPNNATGDVAVDQYHRYKVDFLPD